MNNTNIGTQNPIFRALQAMNTLAARTSYTPYRNRANYTETLRAATHSTKGYNQHINKT
jgi:hypothetical protein